MNSPRFGAILYTQPVVTSPDMARFKAEAFFHVTPPEDQFSQFQAISDDPTAVTDALVVLKVGNGKGAGTQKTQEGKLYYVTTGDIGKGQRKPALDYVEVPVGLKPLITRLVNAMPNGGLKAQFQQALEALS